MTTEIWKDVVGYEGRYMVSNTGKIKSLERRVNGSFAGTRVMTERILKPAYNPQGYLCVSLNKNHHGITTPIHRIIAAAFIENPSNKRCINHKNGVRDDNRLENLEWCTHSENNFHAYNQLGKKSPKPRGFDSKYSKTVKCDTLDMIFGSANEAARQIGTWPTTITEICRGERKEVFGLTFRYIT